MKKLYKILSSKKVIVIIYLLLAIGTSTHLLLIDVKIFEENGRKCTYYNNYQIFKYSYYHLTENKDLYKPYPDEHWDLFKYSPAFSLFFAVFAVFPDYIGLNLWNLFNALILLISVYCLPNTDIRKKGIILLFCLIELITSMQNSQSNALIAGLMILAFGAMERKSYWSSALFIVLSAFIKLFGIVGLLLFLLYPKKWRSALFSLIWIIVLGLIPLLVIDIHQLKFLYSSWFHLLVNDHSTSYGLSIPGMLNAWLGIPVNKIAVLIAGMVILLLPLVRINRFKDYLFRLLMLTSVLIWVVIFNHRAESNTYIIAFAGIAIWYFSMKRTPLNTALFLFAFVFIALSPTDIIPRPVRLAFFEPYMLKVLPAVVIWLKIIYDLMVFKGNQNKGFPATN